MIGAVHAENDTGAGRQSAAAPRAARLPLRARVGWAVGDTGFSIYWQALNLLLLPFYTDVMGLTPVLAGTVFLVASLWDGFADSVIGAVADRTRTRRGSYRPFLLWTPPVMIVAFMALFLTPEGGQGVLFAYALASQLMLRTVYSLASIPYSTLSARISSDPDERSTLAGLRIAFAMLGGIAVTFMMPAIVDALTPSFGARAYTVAAGAAGLVSLPAFWLCFLSTSEPPRLAEANPRGFHWGAVGDDLRHLARIVRNNPPLLRVFGCMIVSSLAFTMTNKCLVYYVNHYLDRPDLRGHIIPLALFVNLVFCLVWAEVARRTSKREAWLWATAISIAAYLLFYFVPTRDPTIAMALIALISIGNAAYITLVWAMLPDTVEYCQFRTGLRHDAKVFGLASFCKQLASGVNGFVLGLLLGVVGYVEGADAQTASAIDGVKAIMTLVPLVGLAFSAWIIWGYRLDRTEHARITAVIAGKTA